MPTDFQGIIDDDSVMARITIDYGQGDLALDDGIMKAGIDNRINDELMRSTSLYHFPNAWKDTAGENVRVAVIDTGIDTRHAAFGIDFRRMNEPFCSSVIVRAASVINDSVEVVVETKEEDGRLLGRLADGRHEKDLVRVHDSNGHGTHCAGIIAARPLDQEFYPYEPIVNGHNGQEVSAREVGEWKSCAPFSPGAKTRKLGDLAVRFCGVAPKCKLMVYKVTEGDSSQAKADDIARAIDDAVDEQADIISLSMEAEKGTYRLYKAVHRALYHGRMFVAAAGNQGTLSTNGIGYPAHYGGVITVASHDKNGQQSGYTSSGGEIDLGAPGENIWSTWTGGPLDRWEGGRYKRNTGTSMATPFVAGIAALMIRSNGEAPPIRNNEELRQRLLDLTTHRGLYDPTQLGYGAIAVGSYAGSRNVFL